MADQRGAPAQREKVDKAVEAFVRKEGLTARSALRTNVRIAAFVLLYVAAARVTSALPRPLDWIAYWTFQSFAFTWFWSSSHEAMHGNLYQASLANRVFGIAASTAIFYNFSLYRAFHIEHHKYTRTPDDPEEPQARIDGPWSYLAAVNALPFFRDLWLDSFRALLGSPPAYCKSDTLRRHIWQDAVLFHGSNAATLVLLWHYPSQVLGHWLVPFTVYALAIFMYHGLSEHHGCSDSGPAFETTRTVVGDPLVRFLNWNGNYHVEHHLFPSVPYYNLPRIHEFAGHRMRHVVPTYTAFHRQLWRKAFGLKAA